MMSSRLRMLLTMPCRTYQTSTQIHDPRGRRTGFSGTDPSSMSSPS
jgi:hypothetical protein